MLMSEFVLAPPPIISLPIVGRDARFPIRRIYCAGRNYADHITELGNERPSAPVFFCKNRDELLTDQAEMRYPPATDDLQYEVELVVAFNAGGRNIRPDDVPGLIFGFAVGLDMTRRDLQRAAQASRLPWDMAKSFDQCAPCGPIVEAGEAGDVSAAQIQLSTNGEVRQRSDIGHMIWNIAELVSALSQQVKIAPGDLLFTGTPAGVGTVRPGDELVGTVTGLPSVRVVIAGDD